MTTRVLLTERPIQAIDVTDLVCDGLAGPGVYLTSCPHTTAALMLMECDDELLFDLEQVAARIGTELGPLRHNKNNNPNGAAHVMSGAFGTQVIIPIDDDVPSLGTYQRIIFLELDGPRERHIELRKLC